MTADGDPPRLPFAGDGEGERDLVEEADVESFPASDPPSWTAAIPAEQRPRRPTTPDEPEP